jgi:hypothetical protein
MIEPLNKVIRENVTQCVIALPLKRNLIPRFTKGEGVPQNDEGCFDIGETDYQDS